MSALFENKLRYDNEVLVVFRQVLGMTAEKIGLVVITFERYFKTVHAIAHRNYYRSWMTSLGVVVPWIAGFCTFAIPAIVSTRAVPGHCPMMGFWPSEDFLTVNKLAKYLFQLQFLCVQLYNDRLVGHNFDDPVQETLSSY